jgi:hypothetical protein
MDGKHVRSVTMDVAHDERQVVREMVPGSGVDVERDHLQGALKYEWLVKKTMTLDVILVRRQGADQDLRQEPLLVRRQPVAEVFQFPHKRADVAVGDGVR